MSEIDIDERLEKYWERFKRQLSTEEVQELETLLNALEEHFIDPTAEHPVKPVEFARWLDPSPLVDLFKQMYHCFDTVKDRLGPRIRFLAYFSLSKRKNLWQAYHALTLDEYLLLGFTKRPTYELLREFIYERINVDRLPLVMDQVVQELQVQLKKQGILLGERVFEDATDTRSLKHDPDAEYSGYYDHYGYKLDYTMDAGQAVPLEYIPMRINENEGENLIPSMQHLISLGVKEKERVIDLKYATYQNIAYSETKGVSLYYEIAEHWIYNKAGTPGEIKRRYQKYHTEPDFIPGADLDRMLHYLYKKGEHDIVGAFYRNQRMAEREEHPEGYDEIWKERGSGMEGDIGRVKLTTLLDDHPCRRGWRWFLFRAGLTMLSLVFAALIRVQNGVYNHLANVTYIT